MKSFYDFEAWYTKNVNTRGLYLVLKTFIQSLFMHDFLVDACYINAINQFSWLFFLFTAVSMLKKTLQK